MTITGFEDVEEMLNKLANPYEMAEKAGRRCGDAEDQRA